MTCFCCLLYFYSPLSLLLLMPYHTYLWLFLVFLSPTRVPSSMPKNTNLQFINLYPLCVCVCVFLLFFFFDRESSSTSIPDSSYAILCRPIYYCTNLTALKSWKWKELPEAEPQPVKRGPTQAGSSMCWLSASRGSLQWHLKIGNTQ